jgi:hypothetical protein
MTFNDGLYIQSMELVYSVKLPLSMNTLSIVHPTLLTNIACKTPPPSIHGPSIDVDVTMQSGFDTVYPFEAIDLYVSSKASLSVANLPIPSPALLITYVLWKIPMLYPVID